MFNDLYISFPLLKYKNQANFLSKKNPLTFIIKTMLWMFLWNPLSSTLGICGELILD